MNSNIKIKNPARYKEKPALKPSCFHKWQQWLDTATTIFNVPAGYIYQRIDNEDKLLIKCRSNPSLVGSEESKISFDETRLLQLSGDSIKGSRLCKALIWPDGEVFGVLCLMDNTVRNFHQDYQSLLNLFCHLIQEDLKKEYEKKYTLKRKQFLGLYRTRRKQSIQETGQILV